MSEDHETEAEPESRFPEEVLNRMKAEHGSFIELGTDFNTTMLFRICPPDHWRRVMHDSSIEDKRADAAYALFNSCVIWPEEATRKLMLKGAPGFVQAITSDLMDFCGTKKATIKKVW